MMRARKDRVEMPYFRKIGQNWAFNVRSKGRLKTYSGFYGKLHSLVAREVLLQNTTIPGTSYFPIDINIPDWEDLLETDLFKNHGITNDTKF